MSWTGASKAALAEFYLATDGTNCQEPNSCAYQRVFIRVHLPAEALAKAGPWFHLLALAGKTAPARKKCVFVEHSYLNSHLKVVVSFCWGAVAPCSLTFLRCGIPASGVA